MQRPPGLPPSSSRWAKFFYQFIPSLRPKSHFVNDVDLHRRLPGLMMSSRSYMSFNRPGACYYHG